MFAIIVVPMQTTEFISTLSDHYKNGLPYVSRAPHVVVVIPANMTTDSLDVLLTEFFQSNAALLAWDVVLLGTGGDEHRQTLLAHVRSTQYWDQISYIVGSPSSTDDLDKAAIKSCQAVFLLTPNSCDSAEKERQADELTLLRAISIKHYCPYVPIVLSINSPRNKGHVLWERLSLFPSIETLCLNELKMRLFATASLCPGLLGVVTNLCQSFDGKSSFASLFVDPGSASFLSGKERASSSLSSFAAQSLILHPLEVSVWPLSATRCPPLPLPPHLNSSDASLFWSAATRRWDEEYLAGFGHRLYAIELPAAVDGLCFSEAAAMMYERLTLVMVAIYRADQQTGKLRVILAPGYAVRLKVREGDLACVLAQSEEHAESARDVSFPDVSIRDRWQAARQIYPSKTSTTSTPLQPATVAFTSAHAGTLTTASAVTGLSAVQYEPHAEMKLASTDSDSSPWVDEEHSFRCNGVVISPIMPLSSAAAQTAIAHSDSAPSGKGKAVADGGPHHNWLHQALTQYVNDPYAHIDPITGNAAVTPPPAIAMQLDFPPTQPSSLPQPQQPGRTVSPFQPSSLADPDPYKDHVVLCGFIDSRVIIFLRQFRVSDRRPVLLVLHKPADMPEPVQTYVQHVFQDVHIVHAEQDGPLPDDDAEDDSHDNDGLFLAYSKPCYGHRHRPITPQHEPLLALGADGHEGDKRHKQSTPSMDEFSADDEAVARALHRSNKRSEKGKSESTAVMYDDSTGAPMEYSEMLKRANWYRRACLHRAFSVLILASSYSQEDTDGDYSVDSQAAADRDGLVIFSAIRTYLQQCRLGWCPTMPYCRPDTLVSIELLYHTNARLLKHNAETSLPYEPDQPMESGLAYVYHMLSKSARLATKPCWLNAEHCDVSWLTAALNSSTPCSPR